MPGDNSIPLGAEASSKAATLCRTDPAVPAWTIQSLVAEMAAHGRQPGVICVRAGVLSVSSFEEIAEQARRLASGLVRIGVGSGDPVLLFGPNSVDWIIVRLALGVCGALCVALDDLATDEDMQAVLKQSRCRRAFCAAKHVARLHDVSGEADLELYLLDPGDPSAETMADWRSLLPDRPEPIAPVESHLPAMLLYTSGTTGAPKPFTLSYDNMAANIQALMAGGLVGTGDQLLLPLPLHHAYPQVVGLFTTFSCGAAIVLPESAAGPKILEALRAADATGIIGVPRLYTALVASLLARISAQGWVTAGLFHLALKGSILLRRRFGLKLGALLFKPVRRQLNPALRLLVSGGARLDSKVVWTLIGLGWDVRSGYGLAETSSIFTGNLPGRERIGSEGKPFPGSALRIAEPDETGAGEIQLRGPSVFAGYLDDAKAAQTSFTDDGWFRTGDLGTLDADGFLYVTGRTKEVIVLGGGKKVVPEELERIYSASPYIEEIAILERGGALAGLVVADLAAIRGGGFTRVEDLLRVTLKEAGGRLPPYQRLAGFAIAAGTLPRTRFGKLRRFLLPRLYEETLAKRGAPAPQEISEHDRALLDNPQAQAVWHLLAERYSTDRLSLNADLELDLGIDSLEWITLSLELQRLLRLEMGDAEMTAIATVRDLLHCASRAPAQDGAPSLATVRPSKRVDGAQWLDTGSPTTRASTLLLYLLNRLIVRVFFRLRTDGIEELPPQGAFIIVANHCSDLDPLTVAAALPWRIARRIYWGGDAGRLFRRAWARPFLRAAHVFPVDGRLPALSLSRAAAVLRKGNVLVWFPEEWRSPTGELQQFQPGIGWIVAETSIPVTPAFITGTFEAMPRHRRWPKLAAVSMRFGCLIERKDLPGGAGEKADPQQIAKALRVAVAKLCTGEARQ